MMELVNTFNKKYCRIFLRQPQLTYLTLLLNP